MEYYVYILKSLKSDRTYVGMTSNVDQRLAEHNRGKCPTTSIGIPWKLLRAEKHPNSDRARRREKYLKSGDGRLTLKSWVGK